MTRALVSTVAGEHDRGEPGLFQRGHHLGGLLAHLVGDGEQGVELVLRGEVDHGRALGLFVVAHGLLGKTVVAEVEPCSCMNAQLPIMTSR